MNSAKSSSALAKAPNSFVCFRRERPQYLQIPPYKVYGPKDASMRPAKVKPFVKRYSFRMKQYEAPIFEIQPRIGACPDFVLFLDSNRLWTLDDQIPRCPRAQSVVYVSATVPELFRRNSNCVDNISRHEHAISVHRIAEIATVLIVQVAKIKASGSACANVTTVRCPPCFWRYRPTNDDQLISINFPARLKTGNQILKRIRFKI